MFWFFGFVTGWLLCSILKFNRCHDGPCTEPEYALDCDICGNSIECHEKDGTYQPDKDVVCDECGALYVLNVEEDDVWLILSETGYERLASVVDQYGQHKKDCALNNPESTKGCSCGLDEVLVND